MNTKQIQALLSEKLSDENVRVIAAWIKAEKPTNKVVYVALQEVLALPEFKAELIWLADWIKSGSWTELISLARTTKSATLFEWIVQAATDSPGHSQAGELWNAIVENTRDYRVLSKASQWLIENCSSTESCGMLACHILSQTHSEKVIQKARKLLTSWPEDMGVLLALVQFDSFEPAFDRAIKLLTSKDRSASLLLPRLLGNDSQRFFPIAEKFFRRHWRDKYLYQQLEECLEASPDIMLPLVKEWIDSPKDPETISALMRHCATISSNPELNGYIWSWTKKRLPDEEALEIFQVLLGSGEFLDLPPEILAYAREWLSSNKSHSLWPRIAALAISAGSQGLPFRLGDSPFDELNEANCALVFSAVAQHSDDPNSLAQARKWHDKFTPDKRVIGTARALCDRFPDGKLIEELKSFLPTGDRSMDWSILAVLVKAADKESIKQAKDWLTHPQIIRRWTSQHGDRGALIKALVEGGYGDLEICEMARQWLTIRATIYEQRLYNQVKQVCDCDKGCKIYW